MPREEKEGQGGQGEGEPGSGEEGHVADPLSQHHTGAGVLALGGGGEVDNSMLPKLDTEEAGGQSLGQRGAGTEPPVQAEGENTRARSPAERSPAKPNAGSLRRVSPPRRQTGPGAVPGDRSAGAGGSARAPKSGSRKRKLDATSG